MEVSYEMKEEIRKAQGDLKRALRVHQIWVTRLKELKDDENRAELLKKQKQAERQIEEVGLAQQKVIERLRNELLQYQDRLRARNKIVNAELDCRSIAAQLREHQRLHETRKKPISLLPKPSVLSEIKNVPKKRYYVKKACVKPEDMDDDSEFIKATENFSLKDDSDPRRCSSLAGTLKKLKANIEYGSTDITIKPQSPQSYSSKSSTPSPVNIEPPPRMSPPLALPLPRPGEPITQETFLRIFGLITPRQRQILEKKRDEKKKRLTTSTNKNEYVYENFDSKRKKSNFPYLQQNVGPPQTRAQKMRKQLQKRTNSNTSPSGSPSISPPPWTSSLNLPSGLVIQPVPSPSPKFCTVCRQNDSPSVLMHCQKCKSYFHPSCSSSPSSRSPSSRSRSPINMSDRYYHHPSTICPECGEEIKESKTTWMVVSKGYSNNCEAMVREKTHQKKLLMENLRQMLVALRELQEKRDAIKEKIESSNIEKKQLISNQNNTKKRIDFVVDFVNTFRDPSDRIPILPPLPEFDLSRSLNGSKEIEDFSTSGSL